VRGLNLRIVGGLRFLLLYNFSSPDRDIASTKYTWPGRFHLASADTLLFSQMDVVSGISGKLST
jgi:hypothetical protein